MFDIEDQRGDVVVRGAVGDARAFRRARRWPPNFGPGCSTTAVGSSSTDGAAAVVGGDPIPAERTRAGGASQRPISLVGVFDAVDDLPDGAVQLDPFAAIAELAGPSTDDRADEAGIVGGMKLAALAAITRYPPAGTMTLGTVYVTPAVSCHPVASTGSAPIFFSSIHSSASNSEAG